MATLMRFKGVTCECDFNLSSDVPGHRYLTHAEAKALHQQQYDAEPWRVRLINPQTGDTTTHIGIPESDPWVQQLRADGWLFLHEVYPDFPQRFKNVSDPAKNPQPFPKLCQSPVHRAIGHRKERWEAVMHESARLQVAAEILSARLGKPVHWSEMAWSFDDVAVPGMEGARVLRLDLSKELPTTRNAVRETLALQFGPGQVEVD